LKQQLEIEASSRPGRGKNSARRLRGGGKVPAVLYGQQQKAIAIALDAKEMTRILASPAGHNRILNVKIEGGTATAGMVADWQVDPVRGVLLHVDVRRVDLNQKVSVTVPVQTIGVAVGVKEQGGFEEVVTREIEIECLPLDIPEKLEVDISNLTVGQSIRAGDVPLRADWTLRTNAARVMVHVVAKKAELEVPAEAAAAPAAEGAAPAEEPKAKPEQ
jgi:large subunit ribosomal protein L25